MSFKVRDATTHDVTAILALMPRLADFDIPEWRNPADLWLGDATTLKAWADGDAPECLVQVAIDDQQELLGFTMVSLRPELLSQESSAHLEAIAVTEGAEGKGVGQALLAAAETGAQARGAETITLHVFASNSRAREFYARASYDGELIRYIKHLTD